jgi:hypothetical protein
MDLIKDFQISDHIVESAKNHKFPPPGVIRSAEQLVENLQAPNWRLLPMQFDMLPPPPDYPILAAS